MNSEWTAKETEREKGREGREGRERETEREGMFANMDPVCGRGGRSEGDISFRSPYWRAYLPSPFTPFYHLLHQFNN